MAREIASFAENTPMESHILEVVDDKRSFLSVFYNSSSVSAEYSLKYEHEVVGYCVEWEAVVSSRVDKDADVSTKLREVFNHYQDKVDTLRKKVTVQETKGKPANNGLVKKLQRNEVKLDEACELYESTAIPLCVLIEEIVQDVYPLIQSTMKFEMERSQSEAYTFHLFQCDAFDNEIRSGRGQVHSNGKVKSTSPLHNQNLERTKLSSIPASTTLSPTKAQMQPIASTKKPGDNVDKASHFDDSLGTDDHSHLDSLGTDDQSHLDSRKVVAV
jgi:hypothetical protein